MNVERALLAAAAALATVAVVAAFAVPGAVAPPEPDRQPSYVAYTEMTVSPAAVAGDTVTLDVTNSLTHEGGPARNVTVRTRAIDAETGFVATSEQVSLGTLTGTGEHETAVNLTVERNGGYRLETTVYENGSRVASGHRTVHGVGTLLPDYARSPIRFHEFDGSAIPTIRVGVSDADKERTTLDVGAYVTNAGGEGEPVRIEYVARQAESNLVADRATVDIANIASGRTVTPNATLDVPAGYNYYIDAVLWKNGVIIDTTTATATLDPTRAISVNQTRESTGLDVGEFEGGTIRTPTTTSTASGGSPGFGIPAVLAAFGAVALLARRWSA